MNFAKILGVIVAGLSITALAVVIAVSGTVLTGYTLSKLWEWFVVPTFHVQPISTVVSIGIGILIRFCTTPIPKYSDFCSASTEDSGTISNKVTYWLTITYLIPLLALFIGWIVTLFL